MFEDFDQLQVAPGDFGDGGFARDLSSSKVNERIPKIRPAHGEADESFNAGRRCQPLAHFLVVLATSENDAADFLPAIAARNEHDRFAILATIESFDLPDIRLNARRPATA